MGAGMMLATAPQEDKSPSSPPTGSKGRSKDTHIEEKIFRFFLYLLVVIFVSLCMFNFFSPPGVLDEKEIAQIVAETSSTKPYARSGGVEAQKASPTPRDADTSSLLVAPRPESRVDTYASTPRASSDNTVERSSEKTDTLQSLKPMGGIPLLGFAAAAYLFILTRKKTPARASQSRHAQNDTIKQESDAREWAALQQEAQQLTQQLLGYREDLSLLLEAPLMIDLSHPTIAAAYRNMDLVRRLQQQKRPTLSSTEHVSDTKFFQAVLDFRVSLAAAEDVARITRTQHLGTRGQQAFKRAKLLWAIAEDEGATPAERRSAYGRVLSELEDVIPVPQEARFAINRASEVLAIGA